MILNSNRLRTFEDARLEIVTYVEAKFGLRIRDSSPSHTVTRGQSDVVAVNSFSSGKGNGSSSPRDGCFNCGGAHFQRDCNARKSPGKQSSGKGKQSKSWSKSEGKERANKVRENVKEHPKVPKFQRFVQGKTSKTGLSGLENPKSETSSESQELAQTYPTHNSYTHTSWFDDGWSYDEWNDHLSSVGWHEGWDQTCDNSASSFSLGSADLGAMSCPKRFECVKKNLDTGAAVNTCPLNFGPGGAGDGNIPQNGAR